MQATYLPTRPSNVKPILQTKAETKQKTNSKTSPVPVVGSVIEPWHEPVGSEIFDEIQKWWKTYTFMTDESALLLTLWSAHANMWKGFQNTPRLVIDSPTKGCGKTLVLTVLGWLINQSKESGSMSEGAFIRYCSKGELVFLCDEADHTFRGSSDLTGVLNNGWHQHGSYDKCVGDTHEPTAMPVHSAVALAGINIQKHLQEPTLDRSIIMQMMKARPGDLPERFRERKHKDNVREMGRKLLRWCNDHKEDIWDWEASIPDDVPDRDYWKWSPIVSIAEFINEDYAKRALRLMRNKVEIDEEDQATVFLRDCKQVYDKHICNMPRYCDEPSHGMHQVGIQPNALAKELCLLTDDDDPDYRYWTKFHAHKGRVDDDAKLMGRDCSKFLKSRYHIRKKSIRWGNDDGQIFDAYGWTEILDAQKRYAPVKDQDAYVPGGDMEPPQ